MSFTVGSLFDGSGGFPLAAFLSGGVPKWASEIEPYPIAVTKTRFPYMKHLGSVTAVKGNEVEPVDVITFGSPCQDLSIAGKQAGLKHTNNGDEETTRSGLFMEAVRIIKEMREATNGVYPRFALWENVPGAFSSNKGEDFRIVLEELIKIVEPFAVMPTVPKSGWPYADHYCGDGWSLAYRVLDAQYWGVPQRRKRIYLVLDLGGQCAGEVSFERDGLRGYFAESGTAREDLTGDVAAGSGAADCETDCVTFEPGIAAREGGHIYPGVSGTIRARAGDNQMAVAYCGNFLPQKKAESMGFTTEDVSCTVHQGACAGFQNAVVLGTLPFDTTQVTSPMNYSNPKWGDPCHPLAAGAHPPAVVCLEGNGSRPSHSGDGWSEANAMYTLNTIERHAVAYGIGNGQANQSFMKERTGALNCMHDQQAVCYGVDCRNFTESPELYPTLQAKPNGGQSLNYSGAVRTEYIVRRLTPGECCRLQGFPDFWGHPEKKTEFTEEEYQFWLNVRNTHGEINGKPTKSYTKDQMLTWYNKLHTDSSEYKLWGNGIALPCALYFMQGIADVLN